MPNNERVSQLIELFATDLQSNDIFLISDMSQLESKKIEMGQLLLFIESSGSFFAYDSVHADTASFVLSQNIGGTISLVSSSLTSISSSWSNNAGSSSYTLTSSYSYFATEFLISMSHSDTTSFIQYSGIPNGTSSYSLKSGISDNSTTAYNLFYNGQPNGTSSVSISSSYASSSPATTLKTASAYSITSSWSNNTQTASYLVGNYNPIKAWSYVTWSSIGITFPIINTNYNIGNMTWLSSATIGGGADLNKFVMVFTQPLLNTNYTLIGNGFQPLASTDLTANIDPVTGNKTTSSFTMSVYTATGYSVNTAFINFFVLGL